MAVAGQTTEFDLLVDGMNCASCVGRVERGIRAVPGVASAEVNLVTGCAHVTPGPDGVAAEAVAAAVAELGYPARSEVVTLAVEDMTCASCVGRVERAIAAVPGVRGVTVNLATGRARVEALAGAVSRGALIEAVQGAGYGARAAGPAKEMTEEDHGPQRRALVVAAILTAPLFVLEMGGHAVPAFHHWLRGVMGTQVLFGLQFVLASLVLFGPGRVFFVKGWPALRRGAPDMNALVMVGTFAAWGYSSVATFVPAILPAGSVHVYFEAVGVIVTLVLLGRWLEARAKGRSNAAIARLVGLQPRTARVMRDGQEIETEAADLIVGDVVRVRPGERVASDGVVVTGASFVDEAMVTGEPVPVEKTAGAEVVGGTINGSGSFDFEVLRVGSETVLAQIAALVAEAQADKLPVQALVDRVTLWFVPAVMAAAAVTLAVWLVFGPDVGMAVVAAVAVLIVACPCAMGLAVPVSILVGSGRAAEMGLLFRRGAALQQLSGVDVVAFDKTGTLTEGKPRLTDLITSPGFTRTKALALAAAVEARAEHPVARAIVTAAGSEGLAIAEAEGFEATAGLGAAGRVDGSIVRVGTARFFGDVDMSGFAAEATRLEGMGRGPLYLSVDGRAAAVMAVSDEVKPGAKAAVAALRTRGIEVVMVTGDNRRTAEAVAGLLGIGHVVAEVLPGGKVDAVKDLQGGGRRVAFVGDGVNDAPALAQAEVGIAIGTGTDVAIEAADVVLMSGDPGRVPDAVALAKAVIRNVRQNLFWAFAYNVALIPVAAGVLYPAFGLLLSPVLAAGAMAISSVSVVTNALRLRRFRRAGT